VDDWTFTERVDLFLELANGIDDLRLSRTGIDLGAGFDWKISESTSASISPVDRDDFRSFVAAWRQLVTRSEPTHLPTLLRLCANHLTHRTLRDLASQLLAHVDAANDNENVTDGFRMSLWAGEHQYTPWEVADLIMHGSILHSRDRAKRKILRELDPWMLISAEHIFRRYVVGVTEAMGLARLILAKAKEKAAISDEPIDLTDQPG
jgi:hypothetical protein